MSDSAVSNNGRHTIETQQRKRGRGWLPPRNGGYTPVARHRDTNSMPPAAPAAPDGPAGVSRQAPAAAGTSSS